MIKLPHLTVYEIALPIQVVNKFFVRSISKSAQKEVEDSYKILNVPPDSKPDVVRQAFLELAKKYHPDSQTPEAYIEKFVEVENAFRIISKYKTGSSGKADVEKIVFDIRHTAPQHRQYLSYEGVGHGTPYQREKQWIQVRAQKAANNVMEYRVAKAVATENTIMKKDSLNKHDIKTKYGFDRLVEDLIQEAMSKGEFENLSGKGKPLKDHNSNPYVDFTTHKLNEVLINNGFTPEWITMGKEIDQDIEFLKDEIQKERMYLGPYPFSEADNKKWLTVYETNKKIATSINTKINTYNLIVPLLNKQKFHVEYDEICQSICINGQHSVAGIIQKEDIESVPVQQNEDIISIIVRAISEIIFFKPDKKKA